MYRKQMKTDKFTAGDDPVIGNENDNEKRIEQIMTLGILDWCENDRDSLARGIPYAHVVTMISDCTERTLKSDGLAKGAEVALGEIEGILQDVVKDTKERPQSPPNKDDDETTIYISRLENRRGRRGKKFRDFEEKVIAYIKRAEEEKASIWKRFRFSFVEFVVFEVSMRNWIEGKNPVSPIEHGEIVFMRYYCRLFHGVTPRHHASRYRDLITSELAAAGFDPECFTCYLR